MGSGDACVALAGGEGARGTATRATQASPPHASSTPAPTGQRGFFLLNLTPMGRNELRPYIVPIFVALVALVALVAYVTFVAGLFCFGCESFRLCFYEGYTSVHDYLT